MDAQNDQKDKKEPVYTYIRQERNWRHCMRSYRQIRVVSITNRTKTLSKCVRVAHLQSLSYFSQSKCALISKAKYI